MFEYVNTGLLVFGGIVIVMLLFTAILASGKALHENRKIKAPYFFYAMAAFVIAGIIWEGIETKNTVEHNIAQFQKGHELQCTTLPATYLVSKETGWNIHKKYFRKDSLLIDPRMCESE